MGKRDVHFRQLNRYDTDDEEGLFARGPGSDRPIHAAAHGLYQEVSKVQYYKASFK